MKRRSPLLVGGGALTSAAHWVSFISLTHVSRQVQYVVSLFRKVQLSQKLIQTVLHEQSIVSTAEDAHSTLHGFLWAGSNGLKNC